MRRAGVVVAIAFAVVGAAAAELAAVIGVVLTVERRTENGVGSEFCYGTLKTEILKRSDPESAKTGTKLTLRGFSHAIFA